MDKVRTSSMALGRAAKYQGFKRPPVTRYRRNKHGQIIFPAGVVEMPNHFNGRFGFIPR